MTSQVSQSRKMAEIHGKIPRLWLALGNYNRDFRMLGGTQNITGIVEKNMETTAMGYIGCRV